MEILDAIEKEFGISFEECNLDNVFTLYHIASVIEEQKRKKGQNSQDASNVQQPKVEKTMEAPEKRILPEVLKIMQSQLAKGQLGKSIIADALKNEQMAKRNLDKMKAAFAKNAAEKGKGKEH